MNGHGISLNGCGDLGTARLAARSRGPREPWPLPAIETTSGNRRRSGVCQAAQGGGATGSGGGDSAVTSGTTRRSRDRKRTRSSIRGGGSDAPTLIHDDTAPWQASIARSVTCRLGTWRPGGGDPRSGSGAPSGRDLRVASDSRPVGAAATRTPRRSFSPSTIISPPGVHSGSRKERGRGGQLAGEATSFAGLQQESAGTARGGFAEQQEAAGVSEDAPESAGSPADERASSAASTSASSPCRRDQASRSAGVVQQHSRKHCRAEAQPQGLSMQGKRTLRSLAARSCLATGSAATSPPESGSGSPRATRL